MCHVLLYARRVAAQASRRLESTVRARLVGCASTTATIASCEIELELLGHGRATTRAWLCISRPTGGETTTDVVRDIVHETLVFHLKPGVREPIEVGVRQSFRRATIATVCDD